MKFNPAEFSIKNRLMMMIVIIASLIGGWYAYENMARFEDPEFTIRAFSDPTIPASTSPSRQRIREEDMR